MALVLRPTADGWVKIEQLASVDIGNDVEIGANSTVDRGALEDTVVEDGVIIDNLVQSRPRRSCWDARPRSQHRWAYRVVPKLAPAA